MSVGLLITGILELSNINCTKLEIIKMLIWYPHFVYKLFKMMIFYICCFYPNGTP